MRVVDMSGVNLSMFRFDYDLTFAVLLMNTDGTIYHTFAGRDWTDPNSHLSIDSLCKLLRRTLAEHAIYQANPKAPRLRKRFTIEQYPPMARRIRQGKQPKCMHCHMVNDSRHEAAQEAKRYRIDDSFQWPDPVQVGLRLDKEDQSKVRAVVKGSPAARAGLRAGDRLVTVGARDTATFGDVARALHETPDRGGSLKVRFERGTQEFDKTLRLKPRWKHPDPKVFAWRPSKWRMDPKPGFGGPQLGHQQLANLGLQRDAFAFKVQYIVTWGPASYTGRNAQQAGIRKGDIIVSVGGKRDFASVEHFHAWYRLTRRVGSKVPIEIRRNGKRKMLQLPVVVR